MKRRARQVEEPAVEEPAAEEPIAEEPIAEEPEPDGRSGARRGGSSRRARAEGTVEAAPIAPIATQPGRAPVGTPQEGSQPFSPEAQLALAPGSIPNAGYGSSMPTPQVAPTAYGPNYAALAPEAYGVAFPQPAIAGL